MVLESIWKKYYSTGYDGGNAYLHFTCYKKGKRAFDET